MNINLSEGNVFKITLTENINNLVFINANPEANLKTTVTIHITQDATTPFTISYPANIFWSGGVTPTMSVGLSARDRYVFITDDGGANWDGGVVGQNFS